MNKEIIKDIEEKVTGWVASYIDHEFIENRIETLELLLENEANEYNRYQMEYEMKLLNERIGN